MDIFATLEFLSERPGLLTVLLTVIGAAFPIVKWIHEQRQARQENRQKRYEKLLDTIVRGARPDTPPMIVEQIAAIWMLLEFKEFKQVTISTFNSKAIRDRTDSNWGQIFLPDIDKMIAKL